MDKHQSTELLFEMSRPGRRCHLLPNSDVPEIPVDEMLPTSALSAEEPPLPEVGEIDLIRHFVNLSTKNMAIDCNFYPLGSCTMKYNPKRHERLSSLPGMAGIASASDRRSCQGMLQILWEMQNYLAEIAGLHGVPCSPRRELRESWPLCSSRPLTSRIAAKPNANAS